MDTNSILIVKTFTWGIGDMEFEASIEKIDNAQTANAKQSWSIDKALRMLFWTMVIGSKLALKGRKSTLIEKPKLNHRKQTSSGKDHYKRVTSTQHGPKLNGKD